MSQQVKKYRLIILYPGSPELGSIYEPLIGSNSVYKNSHKDNRCINKNNILNHPEYWEEVIEKDYEILSFRHKGSNYIWKNDLQLKDTFCIIDGKAPFTSLKEINKYPKVYEIYSVKRLRDGVVFTIGDNVIHTNNVTYRTGKVTNLHIVSDCIFITTNDRIKGFDTNLCFVEKLKKQPLFTSTDGFEMFADDKYYVAQTSGNNLIGSLIEFIVDKQILHNPEYYGKYPNIKRFAKEENCKQYIADNMRKPLFVTEDGVEIFEGDKVACINKQTFEPTGYGTPVVNPKPNKFLYFSTKAKAEEYILYNKPCLSLNDVLDISEDYVKATITTPRRFKASNMTKKYKTRKLIQLTQTKLKL